MPHETVMQPNRFKANRFMPRISAHMAMALCAVGIIGAGTANASLLGDTVTVGHYGPDSTTPLGFDSPPLPILVESGAADIYTFYASYPLGYRVNVEASSIHADFSSIIQPGETATWAASSSYSTYTCAAYSGMYCVDFIETVTTIPFSFNGLKVSDLNDSSGNPLQSVVVDTNMAGWDSSRISFGADYVSFDWKGLSYTRDTYLNASLDFGSVTTPVPEPEIYAMLGVGLGLLGWVGRRRRLAA